MQKKTGKGSKTRRQKEKHPNLKKNLNLKARRDYIDTHYIDGVRNEKGEMVIRPMNEEEKKWLDDFYGEHLNASFTENPLMDTRSDEERESIKKELKRVKKELNGIQKKINEFQVGINQLEDAKTLLEEEYKELYSMDVKKQVYDENNARNRCLYNHAKKRGKLVKLNQRNYDDPGVNTLRGYDEDGLLYEPED